MRREAKYLVVMSVARNSNWEMNYPRVRRLESLRAYAVFMHYGSCMREPGKAFAKEKCAYRRADPQLKHILVYGVIVERWHQSRTYPARLRHWSLYLASASVPLEAQNVQSRFCDGSHFAARVMSDSRSRRKLTALQSGSQR